MRVLGLRVGREPFLGFRALGSRIRVLGIGFKD